MELVDIFSFVCFVGDGGGDAVGREEISSLPEDQMEEGAEREEAHRKSATRTSPRMATTASAARCFGGSVFTAGLAISGSLEPTEGEAGAGAAAARGACR